MFECSLVEKAMLNQLMSILQGFSYGLADVMKNQTGGRMELNNITLGHPVICYSIYHWT